MKLLINSTNFEVFYKVLPFVDRDFKFNFLESDLKSSTKKLIKIISKEVYDYIISINESNPTEPNLIELIEVTQKPILLDAYRNYVLNNDLSHTNNGRLMRIDESQRSAFQYQIDRDDEALEQKYYRALDELIDYYDELNFEFGSTSWKECEAYKSVNSLFVNSTEVASRIFPISSRYILMMLEPGLKQCENYEILPRIGEELFNQLKEDRLNPKVLLIQEACMFYALSWAVKQYSIQLFPTGTLQAYTPENLSTKGKKVPMYNEVAYISQEFKKDFALRVDRLEQLINKESDTPQIIHVLPSFNSNDKYIDT